MRAALILNRDDALYAGPVHGFLEREAARPGGSRVGVIYLVAATGTASHQRRYLKAAVRLLGWKFILGHYGRYGLQRLASWFVPGLRPRLTVAAAARRFGIPVLGFDSVNSEEFARELASRGVKVALSACSQIYKERVLAVPGLRIFNFHAGLLPRNQGRFPIFWAFQRGDREQGMTCHEIAREIDAGPVLFQEAFDVGPADDVASVTLQFRDRTPRYLARALDLIEAGRADAPLVSGERPFYGPIPTPEQIRELRLVICRRRGASRP